MVGIKETLGVFNACIIYNNDVYDDLDILIDKLGDKRKIIIFDKDILVKIYEFKNKPKNLLQEVNNKIHEDIPLQDDILIHYEYNNRNKKLIIYYMSGGVVIDRLSSDAKKLEVVPIQFIIKEFAEKSLKKKSKYTAIVKIKNKIYMIKVNQNYITESYITVEFNEIANKLWNIDDEIILLDNELVHFVDGNKNKSLNYMIIGDNIYERLFETKRLFTK